MPTKNFISTRSAFDHSSNQSGAVARCSFRLSSGECFEATIKTTTRGEAGTTSASRSLGGFISAVEMKGLDAALSIPVSSGRLTLKPIAEVRF